MAQPGFVASTEGAVSLSAATAKTILAVIPATNKGLTLCEIDVSFDGVTASAVPVLVELVVSTGGAAGTSSSVTPRPVRGGGFVTVTSSAAKTYSAEPTTLTTVREWLVPPTSGLIVQFPLGREPDAHNITSHPAKGGLMIRCTAPATVNVRASMEFEE